MEKLLYEREIQILLSLILFWGVVGIWGRYGLSAERREKNAIRFREWAGGNSRSARFYRAFLCFGAVCTALHVIVTLYVRLRAN